jgi:hypothetical protein
MAETTVKDDDELLRDLVKKVESWYTFFSEHINRARNFQNFMYVDQWDPQIRMLRENASKPVLQANKLTPIMRAIVGSQRKNTPAVDVRDITTNFQVPQKVVDIKNDFLREIFYRSDSDIVFQSVFRQLAECGWGAPRVKIEYEGDTFNQTIRIEPIVDFQAAFWDPLAQEWDKSDGDFCGVHQIMSKDTFKRLYPDIEDPVSMTGGNSDYFLPWNDGEAIVVCEIYCKDYFTKTIVQLNNGKTLPEKDAKDLIKMQKEALEENPDLAMMGMQPFEIVNKRTVRDYKIKHYKFIQNNILECTEWPGKILPIPYGEGDSTIIDGRRVPLPFMQDAVDMQKFYNYIISEIAYAILRSRREQVMAPAETIEGYEEEWRNPDQVQGVLPYKVGMNGEKPEFINPPAFPQQLQEIAQYATQDLQQLTGRYEEARGQESNAMSGIAIAKRQDASNLPVNLYEDNLARVIKQTAKIILDIMPNIVDNERNIMVRGADNKSRIEKVNQRKGLNYNPQTDEYSDYIHNDMTKGDFDVEVRVDGSFDQQKAAALDFLIRLSAINPAIANLIPDLIAENSGLENSQKLIERLKTLLPPQILAKEEGKPPPPPPPPPPPDPHIIAAQMKAQTDMQANQLKQQELAQQQTEMVMNAQLKGLDYKASFAKVMGEIQKSKDEITQAAIEHSATIHSNNSNLTQKIIDAKMKHVALAAQAQELKGTQL